jgi:hypothetical protein
MKTRREGGRLLTCIGVDPSKATPWARAWPLGARPCGPGCWFACGGKGG